ncbi:MAG: retropepsin-like aspartic protease [Candidatus Bathyarchaeia archaeon]
MKIEARRLLVRVRLIGRKISVIENAIIDTGAAFTVIPPEIADFLELEVNREYPRATLVTASGIIETPVRILKGIDVVGIRVDLLPVVVHKIPDPAPVKILLGMNFIEKVRLLVDGKSGVFSLEDP